MCGSHDHGGGTESIGEQESETGFEGVVVQEGGVEEADEEWFSLCFLVGFPSEQVPDEVDRVIVVVVVVIVIGRVVGVVHARRNAEVQVGASKWSIVVIVGIAVCLIMMVLVPQGFSQRLFRGIVYFQQELFLWVVGEDRRMFVSTQFVVVVFGSVVVIVIVIVVMESKESWWYKKESPPSGGWWRRLYPRLHPSFPE